MTRLLRALRTAAVAAPIASAIVAGIAAVTAALDTDWELAGMALFATGWAVLAAMWAHRATTHSCPPPEEPASAERGQQAVNFRGGPEDGGQFYIPRNKDVLGAELTLSGAEYRVTDIEHTCFRADFVQLVPAETKADQ